MRLFHVHCFGIHRAPCARLGPDRDYDVWRMSRGREVPQLGAEEREQAERFGVR